MIECKFGEMLHIIKDFWIFSVDKQVHSLVRACVVCVFMSFSDMSNYDIEIKENSLAGLKSITAGQEKHPLTGRWS